MLIFHLPYIISDGIYSHFHQMIISPADEIQIISSTSLDNADGLKEMLLDPDQDNLYTVSKSQVIVES